MSNEIRTKVSDFLKSINVELRTSYVAKVQRKDGDKTWDCDQWRYTIQKEKQVITGDYFTGLGHRQWTKQGKFIQATQKLNPRSIAYEQLANEHLKPVNPDAAGVLHSLVMDADANNYSFNEWCDNYGYSSDSIKAFNTYQECCEISKKLLKIFSHSEIEQLKEMLQDY